MSTASTDSGLLRVIRARRLAANGDARGIRERAAVSQRELAAALGVSTSTLSRWENGHSRPRATRAEQWADALALIAEATDQ